jgi:hypothetical protein
MAHATSAFLARTGCLNSLRPQAPFQELLTAEAAGALNALFLQTLARAVGQRQSPVGIDFDESSTEAELRWEVSATSPPWRKADGSFV